MDPSKEPASEETVDPSPKRKRDETGPKTEHDAKFQPENGGDSHICDDPQTNGRQDPDQANLDATQLKEHCATDMAADVEARKSKSDVPDSVPISCKTNDESKHAEGDEKDQEMGVQ